MRFKKVWILAGMLAALAAPASAQGNARFGIGATGDFSLESGGGSAFGGIALVEFRAHDQTVGFRADATVIHGQGVTGEIFTGDVVYAFRTPTSMFHPYLLAGGGLVHQPGFTKPAAKAGAGFEYHLRQKNRGLVFFGESTFNLVFRGNGNGTGKDLQVNLGLKFGG